VSADARELGVDPNRLQTEIETKLKGAGLRIVNQDEWLRLPGSPYLYLQTSVMKVDRRGVYAFTVNTSLMQDVRLKRDPSFLLGEAMTWSVGSHGHTDRQHPGYIQQAVGELIDQFLTAYFSVNLSSDNSASVS